MKTLLITATLLTATVAVAAPDQTAPAITTAPVADLTFEQLMKAAFTQFEAQDWPELQKSLERVLPLATTPQEKSDTLRRLSGALFAQGKNEAARDAAQKMFALGVASPEQRLEMQTRILSSYFNDQKWNETRGGRRNIS